MKKEISSAFDTIATSPSKKVRRIWRALDTKEAEKPQNKLEPNLGQSEAKLRPNLGQTWAKLEPNLSQKSSPKKKLEPQLRPQLEPNLSQTWAKLEPNDRFLSLIGLQKKCLLFLYHFCRSSGNRATDSISIHNISEFTQTTDTAVRKAIQRLEIKGFLLRKKFKNGRGGWTKYELPEDVYKDLALNETWAKLEPNLSQTWAKLEPQLRPQLRPNGPSSSSYTLYNKTTTTGERGEGGGAVDNSAGELFNLSAQNLLKLSPEWASVDASPLEPFGFTQSHLHQIIQQNKLTPDVVQQSINAFAYDLRVNKKDKNIKSSLNYFMGILRKGIPYSPSENYKTPEEEALEKYNQWEKASRKKVAELRQQTEDLEFKKWKDSLSLAEKQKIVPGAREESLLQIGHLREHFNQKIWPERKEKVFQSILEKTEKPDEKK